MGKCLVTKLKGIVDNDNILKIEEMKISFKKDTSKDNYCHKIKLAFADSCSISVKGSYFTDKNMSNNLGNTIYFNKYESKDVYISNENCFIIINKYLVSNITCAVNNISFSIDDLKYSKFAEIIRTPKCTQVYGDISSLQNLTSLREIDFQNTRVNGNISSVQNLTSLIDLDIIGTLVVGDISSLQNLTKLVNLHYSSTQIGGDISSLQNLTSLREIRNLYTQTSGELSKLSTNMQFFSSDVKQNYTWNETRNTSASIFALENINLGSSVDKMLQDLANCTDKKKESDPEWYRIINIKGTRTSASDAAVQTLQSKGYTVIITPA